VEELTAVLHGNHFQLSFLAIFGTKCAIKYVCPMKAGLFAAWSDERDGHFACGLGERGRAKRFASACSQAMRTLLDYPRTP
jgi:hypothetical protein